MSRYRSGRRLEWKARAELRAQGFCVSRSAGSKGSVDLFAWNAREMRLIQIGAKTRAEIAALKRTPVPPGAQLEWWRRIKKSKKIKKAAWQIAVLKKGLTCPTHSPTS
jgi:hypothetical protein